MGLSSLYSAVVLLFALWVGPCSSQCATMKIGEESRQVLLQSQLQFSVDLLQNVAQLQSEDNVFFSPYSVYNALLLAYFASANQTEKYLKNALRFSEDMDKSDIFGAYAYEKHKGKLRSISGSSTGKFQLSSVNRMYVSDKEKIRPCIKTDFKEEIVMADFTKNISSTVKKINQFISNETRNEINDFLSPDSLNQNTNLVLVNAAYFRGLWTHPFSPNDTKTSRFSLANGTQVQVTMMTQENKFKHWIEENLGVEVLELPYKEANVSMFILLPLTNSETAISELINKTDVETLQEIVHNANESYDVTVTIPKFMVDQTLELTGILDSMGVGDLFESSADLSVLTGKPGLKLDKAIHKAKVVVDEVGTVAAAASAVFANRFAADVFYAYHPFVYFLFDKESNILLFAGIFNSPGT